MKIYSIFFIALIILTSCGGPCDKRHQYVISQEVRSYTDFGEGSQWIYHVSGDTTNITNTDTFTLTGYHNANVFSYTEKQCDGDDYQQIDYYLTSSATKEQLTATLRTGPNGDNYHLGGDYENNSVMAYIDYDSHTGTMSVSSYWKDELVYMPAYEVMGKQYNDVLKLTIKQGGTVGNYGEYYYAKYIGIIQFKLTNPNSEVPVTYSLKAYNVK